MTVVTTFYYVLAFNHVRLATSDNTASLSSAVISPAKTWYKDSVFRIRLPHLAPLSSCHDMISGLYLTFALDAEGKVSRVTAKPVSPIADFSFDYKDLDFAPEGAAQ